MSSLFGHYDIETMNEKDVGDLIVRPFLHALGFRQGTEATIRTEVPLAYQAAFLGRKNPSKDPPLRGRADYICDLISYGRWVLEVKTPQQELSLEDAQQAHTYAAHVGVAALFYVLTNGREFRLYRTSHPDQPVFSWPVPDTEKHLVVLKNYLSPDALRRHFALRPLDFSKPLAASAPSKVNLVGGIVKYERKRINHPLLQQLLDQQGVTNATIVGGHVARAEDGLIEARLEPSFAFDSWNLLNEIAGIREHIFRTADEYVSDDPERPSIFQALYGGNLAQGTELPVDVYNPQPGRQLLVNIPHQALSEAWGFVKGRRFEGVFRIDTVFDLTDARLIPQARQMGLPSELEVVTEGSFSISFANDD
jgi:hypothetical protein